MPISGTISGMLPKNKTVHRLRICKIFSLKTYQITFIPLKKDSSFYLVHFLRTALHAQDNDFSFPISGWPTRHVGNLVLVRDQSTVSFFF